MEKQLERLAEGAGRGSDVSLVNVRQMIKDITHVFIQSLLLQDRDPRQITRVTTKLRDAGRRSPPWTPASSVVPGRPQDGADGNRRLRWLFEETHKFYANEINATLVEIKYYLQLLSMDNAPGLPSRTIQDSFHWLIEHSVQPGNYLDPIQLVHIDLNDVLAGTRHIQSGHLRPLDRGGRHEPRNAFLMLARSNQLQGNLTVDELLELMERIVERHRTIQAPKTP
jgi:hypothetical protein